ncbi:MAG TPA: hypothetical protein VNT79_10800 [Phycisphaerae bacterium]|nr:hypothetical protein [Phycisphaerae bacterium]
MLGSSFIFAQDDGVFRMEWYSWVGLILIPVILIGYKMYKNKTMS